ncbi:MAG: calcium-binding protein [Verrucomicrobia bacterium]|nr:calcium-binding protein [Verrucomicrobiota bacterium]
MIPEEPERDHRIDDEAIVDCYHETERAMGWYYYLEGKITFPFSAVIRIKHPFNPLQVDEIVTVDALIPEEHCEHGISVEITSDSGDFAIPLEQAIPIDADSETKEAILDWHYWKARGYQF